MKKQNLVILTDKQEYIDILKENLDFSKYNHVFSLAIENRNTIASYIRSIRLDNDKFCEDRGDKMLVVYKMDGEHKTKNASIYYTKLAANIGKYNEKNYSIHCVEKDAVEIIAEIGDIRKFLEGKKKKAKDYNEEKLKDTSQLILLYKEAQELSNKLSLKLQSLGSTASKLYGKELIADLCGGNEIEFRVEGDDFSCIRIEEIVDKARSEIKNIMFKL